jgi:hypothetical protein
VNIVASKKFSKNLESLDVDMDSSQMKVFRSILMAAGDAGKPVKYGEIAGNLETLVGKKYTKAYIYRQLSDLVESEFITVDTIHSPRTYTINEASVEKALNTKRQDKLSDTLTKKQDVTTKLNHLKSVKSQELAIMLHHQLVGHSIIDKSVVIEGIENVRSTIIREFAEGAKEGDLIRVLAHMSTIEDGLGPSGMTELRLIESCFRGVRVRGLLTPSSQQGNDLGKMASYLTPIVDAFSQVTKTGNLEARFTREPTNTYRIVSLNEDKMLLYLTHGAESNVAALIHRRDNPGIVDDAIKTFDRLFEEGIDFVRILDQMVQRTKQTS